MEIKLEAPSSQPFMHDIKGTRTVTDHAYNVLYPAVGRDACII